MEQMFALKPMYEVRFFVVAFKDAWFLYGTKEERDALIKNDAAVRQNGRKFVLYVNRHVQNNG